MPDYLVVFEYTEGADAYAGTRFFTSFDSEADFKAEPTYPNTIVVEQGIDADEAERLCGEVPLVNQLNASLSEIGYGSLAYSPDLVASTLFGLGLLLNR